ncbi:hypothetical protein C8K61_101570 [Pseudomonas sp. GV071]|nr:hypothetical protein C8K61_101570 [Pseudomonas sp. GV071]
MLDTQVVVARSLYQLAIATPCNPSATRGRVALYRELAQ